MTALGIRYLTGCAVSSDMTRQQEFPPHPGRVFMAMAAAHFETEGDEGERGALEWMESQVEAPHLSFPEFSRRVSSRPRVPLETYVPVNDERSGVAVVKRGRQPRSFPTVRLFDDKVFLLWNADAPEQVQQALERLCAKVTRIGHSSSLVQMWVLGEGEQIRPTWIADEEHGERRLRVPEPGTLEYLERTFLEGKRPQLARWHGYRDERTPTTRPIEGPFDSDVLVLQKMDGRSLGLESTLQLTGALRNAAMKAFGGGETPEWVSGHQPDGPPTVQQHAAFFPLPFVGVPFADGHILGLGMAIPKNVSRDEAKAVLGPLLFDGETGEERTIRLWRNDKFWEWTLERETRDRPPKALRGDTWTRASRVWGSVTPVVLHHYPKKNRDDDAERIVLEAFESAALPRPAKVSIRSVSVFEGAGHARAVPPFTEGGEGLCRHQVHVVAEFEELLKGPMLVGRGRFRGYGLFRPYFGEE